MPLSMSLCGRAIAEGIKGSSRQPPPSFPQTFILSLAPYFLMCALLFWVVCELPTPHLPARYGFGCSGNPHPHLGSRDVGHLALLRAPVYSIIFDLCSSVFLLFALLCSSLYVEAPSTKGAPQYLTRSTFFLKGRSEIGGSGGG